MIGLGSIYFVRKQLYSSLNFHRQSQCLYFSAARIVENRYVENTYIQSYGSSRDTSIEKEMDAKEIELLVRLEVEKMPEQRKKIFMMSRFENLRNDEIAERLNITKKTVENHLNLALKHLRQVLSVYDK